MTFKQFLTLTRRESRGQGGKLIFLGLCLAVGVCAIVAVSALVGAIRSGTAAQSRELLGADVVVESRRDLPEELGEIVDSVPGAEISFVRELTTMAASNKGRARLVELIAVRGTWPLYGKFRSEPGQALQDAREVQGVVAEAEALSSLGLEVGDSILVGGKSLSISGVVLEAPEKSGFSFMLGPRLYMSFETLESTGLLAFGSRLKNRALIQIPGENLRSAQAFKNRLERELPDAEYLEIKSHREAQGSLSGPLEKVEAYLGLVALLSLVLGGIGVARIVQAWIDSRTQAISVMRCLGMRPVEVAYVYLGQVTVLAILGSLLGVTAGVLAPRIIGQLAGDFLPKGILEDWQFASMWEGLFLGPLIALLFTLPALASLWRVPPAQVFRSAAEPLPQSRWLNFSIWSFVLLGLFAAAWQRSQDLVAALGFALFLLASLLFFVAGAWILRRLIQALPRQHFELHFRHGLAALLRPGAGVMGTVLSLGLGSLVISTIVLVQDRLSEGILQALPDDAPSVFFIDVQPDQWIALAKELETENAQSIDSVPVVMARLTSVDGKTVKELSGSLKDDGPDRRAWVLTREQRLTWQENFNESNEFIAGEAFQDDDRREISLESKFARDLGAVIGSELVFDVQGIPISLVVTSLRKIEWASFRINFFLVAEPGSLDGAPHSRIASARLEPDAENRVESRLTSIAPNISMIRVRTILEKVVKILNGLLVGIGALGSLTVLAGLGILAGSISSSSLKRSRETALLKVLGMRPRGVLFLLMAEFGVLGFVAGLLGVAGGLGLTALFGSYFELQGALNFGLAAVILGLVTLLTSLSGTLAAARSLRSRPRLVLAGS